MISKLRTWLRRFVQHDSTDFPNITVMLETVETMDLMIKKQDDRKYIQSLADRDQARINGERVATERAEAIIKAYRKQLLGEE